MKITKHVTTYTTDRKTGDLYSDIRIEGICDCGEIFWIEPRPYINPGFADISKYCCRKCGKILWREREDGMTGNCSSSVGIE